MFTIVIPIGMCLKIGTEKGRHMKSEIEVYVPELTNTPGWVSLTQGQKEWLQQRTSNIQQYRKMEGMAAIAGCIELIDVEEGLKGTNMSMTNYIRTVFGHSERTAWRKLKDFKELRKYLPPQVIRTIAAQGNTLLKGASGVGPKELLAAAKQLPAPSTKDEKTIEGYIMNDLRTKLKEQRSDRRAAPRQLTITEEHAAKMALHSLLRYMRMAKLKTSAEKRHWMQRVLGWAMEAEAVSGTMRAGRIAIPDGVIIRRGRPRGSKKKAA